MLSGEFVAEPSSAPAWLANRPLERTGCAGRSTLVSQTMRRIAEERLRWRADRGEWSR